MTPKHDLAELIKTGANEQLEAFLLEQPALAHSKTEQGISILMFAAYCRNKKAVDLLKRYKQELDLFEASSTGEIETVKNILNEFPGLVNEASVDGFSALGLSCFFGQFEMARYLIENGADINQASNNSFKVTPLHSACAISDYAIVELLLKNGADPNAKQQAGVTPLHEAAHHGKTELAKLMIHHKANVNAKLDNGQTPLSMAQEKSFTETASLIQQHGGRL